MSNGMSIPHKKDDRGALFLPTKPQDGYDRASSYQRESEECCETRELALARGVLMCP